MPKTAKKQMKKVTVDLPEKVLQAVDCAAKKNGRTRAGEVRYCLAALVNTAN